jgi:acyl-CoA synthetase (AMP-forming)/AMP-acid ligase II
MESETAKNEIVALVTAKGEIDVEALYKFCRQKAPEYLVPDRILVLDQFAKTETGKIDRPRVIKEAHAKFDR